MNNYENKVKGLKKEYLFIQFDIIKYFTVTKQEQKTVFLFFIKSIFKLIFF